MLSDCLFAHISCIAASPVRPKDVMKKTIEKQEHGLQNSMRTQSPRTLANTLSAVHQVRVDRT